MLVWQNCYVTPCISQTQLYRQCRRKLTLYHEIRYCVMLQSSHAAESSSRISPPPPSTPPHYRQPLTFGGKPRWRIYDSDCTSQPRLWLLVVQRFDQTLSYRLHKSLGVTNINHKQCEVVKIFTDFGYEVSA